MKKKIVVSCLLVFALSLSIIGIVSNQTKKDVISKIVKYQGNNLRVSINGSASNEFPSGAYLVSYQCDNESTVVTWDYSEDKLTISNGKAGGGVSCDLSFESAPQLSSMPVGSYVDYEGTGGTVGDNSVTCKINGSSSATANALVETESPNSCKGQNAREDIDTSGYTYGFCEISDSEPYQALSKYYIPGGWRIAYTLDSKAVLISAGAPECVSPSTNYSQLNTKALKYCNTEYVDGNCNCTDNDADGVCDVASSDARMINDVDFYYITKATNDNHIGMAIPSDFIIDGDPYGYDENLENFCASADPSKFCGLNNSLLDIGETYKFFSEKYIGDGSFDSIYWDGTSRAIIDDYTDLVGSGDCAGLPIGDKENNLFIGFRPVISLSSSVYVTGGTGTEDDPYTIANR